jgi:hypothetical protein
MSRAILWQNISVSRELGKLLARLGIEPGGLNR